VAEPLSRERWVDAALDALAARGIDAVRVEPLARRLRVTKGSFYWHFRDRGALLQAMLRRWEEVATLAIIDEVEAVPGRAEAKLRALFAIALRSSRMSLETALRQWSHREPRARRAVERVDERRMGYLQGLFEALGLAPEEARARTFLAYSSLFGDHFIAAGASLRARVLKRCAALLVQRRRSQRR
jgi:AcrR family transcriptional regulator